MIIAKELYLTKGVGRHRERLSSFELALRDAGIAHYNIVTVSSIFPPQCRLVSRKQGEKKLQAGQVLFVVMSRNDTNEPSRLISATVGLGGPKAMGTIGYRTEHHDFGLTEKTAGDYSEDLAISMLATSMGWRIDLDKSWNQNKEEWKVQGKIYTTRNITQSATGDKDGLWTTVVTAAVMITD